MGIGGGIALLVIGAILSFGISDRLEGVDLTVIGYICMGAGALMLVLALVLNAQRNNTTHRQVVEHREEPSLPPTSTTVRHETVERRQEPPLPPTA